MVVSKNEDAPALGPGEQLLETLFQVRQLAEKLGSDQIPYLDKLIRRMEGER